MFTLHVILAFPRLRDFPYTVSDKNLRRGKAGYEAIGYLHPMDDIQPFQPPDFYHLQYANCPIFILQVIIIWGLERLYIRIMDGQPPYHRNIYNPDVTSVYSTQLVQ